MNAPKNAGLTDSEIIELRDYFVVLNGEQFDQTAFARALLAAADRKARGG